ncbi:IS1249 family transposase [Arthrobacter sulfonylureivorans]|uniref:IS1249 family transposase n=1 Tax=Arthrobacter sulfonylureivorans TaxID=2486855 RepID=UPI0039E2D221
MLRVLYSWRVLDSSDECALCGGTLKRNGKTAAGSPRWRCKACGASTSERRRRPDVSQRHDLEAFLRWLLGKDSQARADGTATGRTLRRRVAWCWNVVPQIPATGQIHDEVQLDGIYLSGGWCCLIAIAGEHVIGWQWCDTEKAAAWTALLERFPAPRAVVVDGGSGLASALKRTWPETKVQRCLVHVQRNVRVLLTLRPRTKAGRQLRTLSLTLTRIATRDEALAWLNALNAWHNLHKDLLAERTYRGTGPVPKHAAPNQTWWYTHHRLRRAYQLMARCVRQEVLFTYLHPDLAGLQIASTTNRIEGGINTGIRYLLRNHRGLPAERRKRAVEWYLYQRSENPQPPWTLIRPEHHQPATTTVKRVEDEPLGPAELGTTATAEEGLWARSGWAGRT